MFPSATAFLLTSKSQVSGFQWLPWTPKRLNEQKKFHWKCKKINWWVIALGFVLITTYCLLLFKHRNYVEELDMDFSDQNHFWSKVSSMESRFILKIEHNSINASNWNENAKIVLNGRSKQNHNFVQTIKQRLRWINSSRSHRSNWPGFESRFDDFLYNFPSSLFSTPSL